MEQTLQSQYNLIKEGKGNKAVFLKSAYRLFPDMLSPVNTFEDTVKILKNRSIISEGIGGVVTSGKKQDWMSIFNENIHNTAQMGGILGGRNWAAEDKEDKEAVFKIKALIQSGVDKEEAIKKIADEYNLRYGYLNKKYDFYTSKNITEAKAEEKETTKEVTDMATRGYDYKDEKNYDNVFGQEFLKGYYTELKDPKNADKDVEELKAIVAKNLAKDINHYVKDGQFGIKGVGYQTEAPGLGTPKESKGKYKSSGYGDIPKSKDLKESVLRSQIQLLIKEILTEAEEPPKAALTASEKLYDKLGSVKKAIDALPEKFKEYKKALEAHLNFKFRD